ncbi:hypothetical protein [Shewanella algae]|uniref:hypothetical protein n=1 Tax=Shewanella algae TaxID=38313 RepID=UPI003005F750
MARLWNKQGIPHGSWEFVRTLVHEYATETCEMCGQKNIRNLDIVSHPDYEVDLKVGQDCSLWITVLPNGSVRLPCNECKAFVIPENEKWKVIVDIPGVR